MKKLGKVFDTFRQTVNTSQRPEKVEESLQSDHFQLAKVCNALPFPGLRVSDFLKTNV